MAGVGNVLRADDGFGPRAVEALAAEPLPQGVSVIETGIGGIHLVQELMRGYNALILFDACDRGVLPGTLFTLEPVVPDPAAMTDTERRDFFADVHYATPIRALTMARAVGALPGVVRIIACQIADAEGFTSDMDPRVAAAVPLAATRARALVDEIRAAIR
ncbi:MAG: hydrogenase maturation protease [Devosia sp.]